MTIQETCPAWPETHRTFRMGDDVRKVRGSQWNGRVVGWYSTELTPEGYAVESVWERGSVQIYPASALERIPNKEINGERSESA